MHYERIVIEADDGGWVRFARLPPNPGAPGAVGHAQDSLELPVGFNLEHVLAAVDATGWVVERGGELKIQDSIGCDHLARIVGEMFSYFDGPDEPTDELLAIKEHTDARFADVDDDVEIPLWAYAWVDLFVREDVADAARSASALWQQDRLTIDVGQLRDRRICELRRRYLGAQAKLVAQGAAQSGMAASARTRDAVKAAGRNAG